MSFCTSWIAYHVNMNLKLKFYENGEFWNGIEWICIYKFLPIYEICMKDFVHKESWKFGKCNEFDSWEVEFGLWWNEISFEVSTWFKIECWIWDIFVVWTLKWSWNSEDDLYLD